MGIGTPKDYREAISWFERAHEHGDKRAMARLAAAQGGLTPRFHQRRVRLKASRVEICRLLFAQAEYFEEDNSDLQAQQQQTYLQANGMNQIPNQAPLPPPKQQQFTASSHIPPSTIDTQTQSHPEKRKTKEDCVIS